MDKNLLGMYDLKIERLKKALERNNMTCNVFNTEEEAIDHIKNVSAPANAIRLHRQTGCAVAGKCVNCMSDQRICASYVKLARQGNKDRIHVIIMRQELGY